jgi:hypothetical protein
MMLIAVLDLGASRGCVNILVFLWLFVRRDYLTKAQLPSRALSTIYTTKCC